MSEQKSKNAVLLRIGDTARVGGSAKGWKGEDERTMHGPIPAFFYFFCVAEKSCHICLCEKKLPQPKGNCNLADAGVLLSKYRSNKA